MRTSGYLSSPLALEHTGTVVKGTRNHASGALGVTSVPLVQVDLGDG